MSDNQDLRIAVLGVGIMGADHVDRITNKIGGARVTVVNDYSLARAEEIAALTPGRASSSIRSMPSQPRTSTPLFSQPRARPMRSRFLPASKRASLFSAKSR
ncbi:hypothetical protein GCM10020255_067820 [Rhodococcus baikonurensis]